MSTDVYEAPEIVQQLRETCHDMRQPLASVFALAGSALAEPGLPDAARARLEQIVEQAEWLGGMIQEFLHDARQEEVGDTDTADWVDPGEPISQPDVIRIVSEVIAAGRLVWPCDVKVISPAAPVRCTLDPVLLRRVITNVLSNAVRAAAPTGLVTVHIRRGKGMVTLVVEDTGPGFGNIPSGTGLGLSAVARNIVRYGGRIECARGRGGGARVCLRLP